MNQLLPDSSLLLAAAPGTDVASSLDDTIQHAAFTGETYNKFYSSRCTDPKSQDPTPANLLTLTIIVSGRAKEEQLVLQSQKLPVMIS